MTRTAQQRVQKQGVSVSGSALAFKYYIHDTASGYTLEMFGPLMEASVSELTCCWETARTTLKSRVLTLDLRGVTSVDEKARQWLASMNQDGAISIPESFLRDTLAGQPRGVDHTEPTKQSFFGRLFNALRFAPKPTL